jgi:transposase
MRIAWRTVGSVIARVVTDGRAAHDPFCGLRRIGIDEISYKRRHRYLTVVVDHDSGRLVWGRSVGTRRRSGASSTLSAKNAVPRSPSSPRTGRSGSRMSCESAA